MEVESCHVSSGGISWPSDSVYRHKIFIYHLQHVLKMRYEAAAIISGYQCYTSKIYLFWSRFVNIYSDTIFSRQIFLLWLPGVWVDAGSVFSSSFRIFIEWTYSQSEIGVWSYWPIRSDPTLKMTLFKVHLSEYSWEIFSWWCQVPIFTFVKTDFTT